MNLGTIKLNIFLQGGLGNQLYIYCFFKRIMRLYPNIELTFNNKFFINDKYSRNYRLDHLKLDLNLDNSKNIDNYFNRKSFLRIIRILFNFFIGPNISGIIEEKFLILENFFVI